jgi:hypothetical protein
MTEDDPWRKTSGGRRKTGGDDSPSGERLTLKEAGHVASNEWMVRRREDHVDQEER